MIVLHQLLMWLEGEHLSLTCMHARTHVHKHTSTQNLCYYLLISLFCFLAKLEEKFSIRQRWRPFFPPKRSLANYLTKSKILFLIVATVYINFFYNEISFLFCTLCSENLFLKIYTYYVRICHIFKMLLNGGRFISSLTLYLSWQNINQITYFGIQHQNY